MPFLSLIPVNFRNLSNKTIDFSAKEIFFVGKNGQGKSNLLESLYYSAYGSSFRTHIDSEIIKNGEASFKLHTIFREEESGISHTTSIYVDKNSKKIEKDGKNLKDRKELINTMPCVLYNHDDLDFVIGSPERRRFFLDQSLSMYDVFYIDIMRRYKRVLKNRNICLKEKKYDLLDSFDIQLVQNGIEIQQKRKNAIFTFNQIFGKLYEKITGIDGLGIKYNPSWKSEFDVPNFNEAMDQVLKHREIEKMMNTTMTGPHRDKVIFVRNGQPFVPTASTGQRRLLALILRTSQAIFYTQITKRKPVILMDDVLLELDPEKRKRVTELLPEYDQLFCTFLDGEPYKNYILGSTKIYSLNQGEWTEIGN